MSGHVDLVLDRLERVKKNGTGWQARCPAHEDRVASLSIAERDGVVLLHCFAGCTTEAVVAELGLQMRDLFPDGGARATPGDSRATVQHRSGKSHRSTGSGVATPGDGAAEGVAPLQPDQEGSRAPGCTLEAYAE